MSSNNMEDFDVWLSGDEDEENIEDTDDPTSFSLALVHDGGQEGGYHVRNRPGEKQRAAVSAFAGRRSVFTVSCNAKAMIHSVHTTLLVYEFTFNSYRGARIKYADILFEFLPLTNNTKGPSVIKVRPEGKHVMEQTTQEEGSERSIGVDIGPENAALKASGKNTVDKVTAHYTIVIGERPQSKEWGDFFQAHFALKENTSQRSGIPVSFTACILLSRDDDKDFICVPHISITPDLATKVGSLMSKRTADDPIIFSVESEPYNKLGDGIEIDYDNLEGTDLDCIWGCTMHSYFRDAVKESKPGKT